MLPESTVIHLHVLKAQKQGTVKTKIEILPV